MSLASEIHEIYAQLYAQVDGPLRRRSLRLFRAL
jgi:hypothetical protein